MLLKLDLDERQHFTERYYKINVFRQMHVKCRVKATIILM